MKGYADTGFLVSLHSRDANSVRALAHMQTQPFPLAWTWLHDLEFRNAMRLRVFRHEATEEEMALVFGKVRLRAAQGVYRLIDPPPNAVAESERLSATYTTKLGTRSLDILHVAHALVLGVEDFLTFDRRQAALAKQAGLNVPDF